jgi:lipoyl-dependent peroxiredoxin
MAQIKRIADAQWNGDLQSGSGSVALGSGAFKGAYSFKSRFEDGSGTNPEELIAAAHAACYSMALSFALAQAGHKPTAVNTRATVNFGAVPGGFAISRIDLSTEGKVPGIDAATFQKFAADAKANCPISKALAAVEITLQAKLT